MPVGKGSNSVIPTKQTDLLLWAQNFASGNGQAGGAANGVTLGYAQYNLAYSQIYSVQPVVNTYAAALTAAPPGRRTTEALAAAKTVAQKNMMLVLRPLIQQVANSPEVAFFSGQVAVSRQMKANIGVPTHDTDKTVAGANAVARTPRKVPDSAPEIFLRPIDNLTMEVRYGWSGAGLRSSNSLKRSEAKPYGAVALVLFVKFTAPVAGRDPYDGMVLLDSFSKSPQTYEFPANVGGSTAYIAGKWVSAKSEYGKWSEIKTFVVPMQGGVQTRA